LIVAEFDPTATGPNIDAPQRLFGVPGLDQSGSGRLVVSADGQRFLLNVIPDEVASAPISVVVNWSE
jgi:hypothetical protein